jgi:hypothetical protein
MRTKAKITVLISDFDANMIRMVPKMASFNGGNEANFKAKMLP